MLLSQGGQRCRLIRLLIIRSLSCRLRALARFFQLLEISGCCNQLHIGLGLLFGEMKLRRGMLLLLLAQALDKLSPGHHRKL